MAVTDLSLKMYCKLLHYCIQGEYTNTLMISVYTLARMIRNTSNMLHVITELKII